jgi:4-amino-4-deoxy-L-arabinose transferase-like glycosyltransferase
VSGTSHPEPPSGQATSDAASSGPGAEDAGPGPVQAAVPQATARREPPPPLEANDRLVTAVFTAAWAVALVVLLAVRSDIPPRERWWIWVAVAGLVMGLFALWYVPHLQRSRARATERRTARNNDG